MAPHLIVLLACDKNPEANYTLEDFKFNYNEQNKIKLMYRILSYKKGVNVDLVDSLGRSLLQLSMCEMQWENIRTIYRNRFFK